MSLGVKAALALTLTFALGLTLGALGVGFVNGRREPPRRGGPDGESGFVSLMEGIVEPRDSAQRAALRPLLEAADRRNREIVDGARQAMRAGLDSLRSEIAPVVDATQLARFDEFVQRQAEGRRQPPGLGPDRRPPPPGDPPPR